MNPKVVLKNPIPHSVTLSWCPSGQITKKTDEYSLEFMTKNAVDYEINRTVDGDQ